MWDLFWHNVGQNWEQNVSDYANGVENGLEGAANSLLHPLDTVAGLGTLAGNIYEDPSGVANGLWDSLQTSEGIGNLVGGIEGGLVTGGVIAELSSAGAVAEIAPAEFAAGTAGESVGVAGETAVGETASAETAAARVVQNTSGKAETSGRVSQQEQQQMTGPVVEGTSPVNVLPSSGKTFAGDTRGNVIPLKPGETLTGSPNGKWLQVRNADGNPTGMRLDDGHPSTTHSDPRAQVPHAHVPGITNPDGTPWLPVN